MKSVRGRLLMEAITAPGPRRSPAAARPPPRAAQGGHGMKKHGARLLTWQSY